MRYIAKFDTEENLNKFSDSEFIVNVKLKKNLSMISFEIDVEGGFTIEDIKNAEGILKLRKNRILSLDIEYKKKVEANLNKVETNESGNTYLGDFETTGPEYATHLELLNTHNYSSYSNLNKFNTTKTGAGVNCFIIDTGINSDNAFLDSGNLNFSTGVDGEKALDVGDGTFTSNTTHGNIDDHGHGTLCAMLIAGDKFGVARDVTLYSQKVLDDKKSGSIDTITDAIDNIIAFKNSDAHSDEPCIVNMSLGIPVSSANTEIEIDGTGTDDVYMDAIKQMIVNDIHVVMAAGNGFSINRPLMSKYANGWLNLPKGSDTNDDPGQGDVIVVGSIDSASSWLESDPPYAKMSPFSNYGTGNTINAVGGNLALPEWNTTNATGDVTFNEKHGTSFSAPIVTGLLALYLETNPTATPSDAKSWLTSTARQNQITNLMKYTEYDNNDTTFSWTDSKLTITQTGANFNTDFSVNDIVQFDFQINKEEFNTFINSINGTEFNDGWYKVNSVAENELVVEPNIQNKTYTQTLDEFSEETILKIAKVNDTHEGLDGVKVWQELSTEHRLSYTDFEQTVDGHYIYITNVDVTENLVAFNPYQPYAIAWDDISSIDLSQLTEGGPFTELKLLSERGEDVSPTTFEITSGELPEGITLNENGTIAKADTFSQKDSYDDVIITVNNVYASAVKTFSVVNGEVIDEELEVVEDEEAEEVADEVIEDEVVEDEVIEDEIVEDEIVEDEVIEDEVIEDEIVEDEVIEDEIAEESEEQMVIKSFVWKDCGTISTSISETNYSEVIHAKSDMCLVWSEDIPDNMKPSELTNLTENNLYYIESASNITSDQLHTDKKNELLSSCES